LVYYLYRYYDPHLQRWPNRDPLTDWLVFSANKSASGYLMRMARSLPADAYTYQFVHNAPVMRFDSLGLCDLDTCLGKCEAQFNVDTAICITGTILIGAGAVATCWLFPPACAAGLTGTAEVGSSCLAAASVRFATCTATCSFSTGHNPPPFPIGPPPDLPPNME
jgi:hypothetical protein